MEEKLSRDERRDPIDLETIIVRRETESPFLENFFLLRIVFFDVTDRNSFDFSPFFRRIRKKLLLLSLLRLATNVFPSVTESRRE